MNTKITCDVEEELRFHIEMLEEKYTRHGLSSPEAKAAAKKRFGNLERVKNQCVEISKRNSPLRRILKTSTIFIALAGVLIHFAGEDYKVVRIGHTLIMIAVSARLLLYVRGLGPSSFLPKS